MRPARSAGSCGRSSSSAASRSTSVRFFASARSAGTTIAFAGDERRRRGHGHARPSPGLDIALFSLRQVRLARARATRRRCRRGRHRQLLGVADGPRRPARRAGGQRRRRSREIPKGIVANPNCTTMVAMPVLKPLHDRGQLLSARRRHLPGGLGAGLGRRRRARRTGAHGLANARSG